MISLPALALVAVVSVICVSAHAGAETSVYAWQLPPGISPPAVPADNPMNDAKVELGRRLFYDRRLSVNESMACSTCHRQERAFSDGQRVSVGATAIPGVRNAMSLTNVAYLPVFTWSNPTLTRLELQALRPVFGTHPVEMGMFGREAELFQLLEGDVQYRMLFLHAFPESQGKVSQSAIVRALASFVRTLLSFNSPYDRYRTGGDETAISPQAKRGEALFYSDRLKCGRCHSGINFTDSVSITGSEPMQKAFHNTGLYNLDGKGAYPDPSHGVRDISRQREDEGRFRTPILRNVAKSAPYMHDGSIATLPEVIRNHYAKGGLAVHLGQSVSPLRSEFIAGFKIADDEVEAVVAFLESLTDVEFLSSPRFADPFAIPRESANLPIGPLTGRGER